MARAAEQKTAQTAVGARPPESPLPIEPPPDTRRRVLARIRRETRVNESGANRMFDAMLRFLDLCAAWQRHELNGLAPVPSPLVDVAWHAFILHTREYTDYCQTLCGGYLHHEPTDPDTPPSEASLEDAYLSTRRAIEARFGGIDEGVWPR